MPTEYSNHCQYCPYLDAKHLPIEIQSIRRRPLSAELNNGNILLIFQAPGIEEWKSGKPISSAKPNSAGAKLSAAFALLGKSRSQYDITNVVQCFPGKKGISNSKNPRDKPPSISAQRACSKWLLDDISKPGYERILVYGRPAQDAVTKLGFLNDPRFIFTAHPTAPGVSISSLAEGAG